MKHIKKYNENWFSNIMIAPITNLREDIEKTFEEIFKDFEEINFVHVNKETETVFEVNIEAHDGNHFKFLIKIEDFIKIQCIESTGFFNMSPAYLKWLPNKRIDILSKIANKVYNYITFALGE